MRIRAERPGDEEAIAAVHEAAFGREAEARIPAAVRASPGFVPALSLVAEAGGELLGHVLVSLFPLDCEDGVRREVPQLGPIGVLPARQGGGIGGALVRAALQGADELRLPLVLLEGARAYYGRFGFRPAGEIGIAPPAGVPAASLLALRLHAYDPVLRGRVVYPPAFL